MKLKLPAWTCLTVFFLSFVAAETPALFTLSDPKGDDHGDGNLRYPLRSRNDMLPGQLDLCANDLLRTLHGHAHQKQVSVELYREPIELG